MEGGDGKGLREGIPRARQILRGIVAGVDIEYEGDRTVNRTCQNLRSAGGDAEAKVSAIIAADVAAGKKAGPFDARPCRGFSASPIGAVPKKNGGIRVIHHLSYPYGGDSINARTKEVPIELGRFDDAADAIRALGKGCLLIKLDVEAAYKQVPVRRKDWPLLGFCWKGKWYYERTLPFGLKSSCRLWELYATALHYFFVHTLGIEHVVHYIDDFLLVVEIGPASHAKLEAALALCARVGIPMAAGKVEGPATSLTFLGIELCTVSMTARLSDARLAELQSLLHLWERKRVATVKELQSLTGILNFACYVVRPGRTYLRRIIDHTIRVSKGPARLRACQIDAGTLRDISWWIRFSKEFNGVGLLYEQEWTEARSLQLFTDACETGWGAVWGNQWIHGQWTAEELAQAGRSQKASIPYLEMLAYVFAAATWGASWAGKKITLRSDATTVVAAVNARTSRAPATACLLRHLSTLSARHGFDVRCLHVAGVDNGAADALSRQDIPRFRALCPHADPHPLSKPLLPPLAEM